MPLVQYGQCNCGQLFGVYITKLRLALVLGKQDPEYASEEDRREETAGEIESAQKVSDLLGAQFVDSRVSGDFFCRSCGVIHRPAELM